MSEGGDFGPEGGEVGEGVCVDCVVGVSVDFCCGNNVRSVDLGRSGFSSEREIV